MKVGLRNLLATIPHQQIKLSTSVPVRQTCFWNKFEPWLCGSNLGRGCQGFWALRNRDIAMVVPPWGGPLTLGNHGPNYSHTTMAQIRSKSSGLADRHRGNEFNLVMWDPGEQFSQANFNSRLKTSLFRSEKPLFVYFARRFLRGRLSLTTLDYDNPCSKGLRARGDRLALAGHGRQHHDHAKAEEHPARGPRADRTIRSHTIDSNIYGNNLQHFPWI